VLKNRSGVDLPTEKVTGILARWKESRRKHATAYLGATLDLEQVGFDARAVQLVEGRQQSVLEIARLSGVPSGMLASAPSGTSLTYRNVEGEKLQVLQAMLPYLVAIESRLSAEDVTPRGQSVRFDLSGMMRPDTATVARMVQSLVPLDVLDVDEGRAFLGLPSRGRAPNPASLPTPGSGAVAERVDPVGITAGAMPTPIRIRADRPRRADGRFAPTHITVTAGEPIDPGDIDGHELPGMVVPWNVAAMVHGVPEPVVFERGSLTADASVRLVLHHDIRQAVGRPVEWADGEDGLRAVFAMGRSARAADARSDALDGILDGFSVGANVTDGYRADGALHITAARLVEVSLVTLPAFTAARVGAARPTEGATP
jgi:HK97 family phage prohead protease